MTVASRFWPDVLDGLAASEVFARLVGIGTRLEQSQQRLLRAAGPLLHQLDLPSREDVEDLAASLERLEGLAFDASRSSARATVGIERGRPAAVHWHESGRGPVLVLLNGWSVSGLVWPRAWIDRLAQRYRVVRIDNRGTGWSRRAPAPFTIADLADDVVTVLDAVGAERATIVGLSMGGMIAQELALRAPAARRAARRRRQPTARSSAHRGVVRRGAGSRRGGARRRPRPGARAGGVGRRLLPWLRRRPSGADRRDWWTRSWRARRLARSCSRSSAPCSPGGAPTAWSASASPRWSCTATSTNSCPSGTGCGWRS